MAVTFVHAYGFVQDVGSGSADIGAPPAGAQMLVVFGTSKGNNVPSSNPPGTTGVTYGGLTCVAKALTPVSGTYDFCSRIYLLESFAGASGTTLAWPANDGAAKNWGAIWVLGDGTLAYIEAKTGGMGNPASLTHDPGAYGFVGNCGVAVNRDTNAVAATLGGSPAAPSAVGTAIRENVGSNAYVNYRMFKRESVTASGTYTQTATAANAAIGSLLFGDVPLPSVRRHQALVIS